MKALKSFIIFLFITTLQPAIGNECGGCLGDPLYSYQKPCGFYVELTGAWVVPSETGLGTFTDSWEYQNSDGSTTALSKPSKADYKGAWGIKLGYDFNCSASNVEIEYFHLHNSKHNFNDTSDNPIGFGSAFFNLYVPINPEDIFISDAYLDYTLDKVDVTFGHWFATDRCKLLIHPSVGLRYINLEHDLTFLIGHVRSCYHGIGPMIGLDGEYKLCGGFSFTSRFDASVLMGSVKADSRLAFAATNLYESPSTDRIVYTFGGSLGVAYDWCICNNSALRLELGYTVENYIGPFDIITAYTDPEPRIEKLLTTNFGYSGPFISLRWHL